MSTPKTVTTTENWEFICHVSQSEAANHLMGAKLFNIADLLTFTPNMLDDMDREYCVSDIQLEPEVTATFSQAVVRPAHDKNDTLNLIGAENARSGRKVVTDPEDVTQGDLLTKLIVYKGTGLWSALGLTQIVPETNNFSALEKDNENVR